MDSEETLLQTNAILDAINNLRREMNERFEKIENEISLVKYEMKELKETQFSLDVCLERAQSMAHEGLQIGHGLLADVKVLTAELRAWASDVLEMQKKGNMSLT